jgi:membrane-associated phospholipid phosphatase
MITLSLENLVSISVIFIYIIPAVLYQYTGNPREIIAIIGAFGTNLLSEGIKHLVIGTRNPRPLGASDCDLACMNGDQSGKPGMPSGHATAATFFAAYYFNETDNILIKIGLVVFAVSIMYSRFTKRCHTPEQIIAGSMFGIIMCTLIKQMLM